MALRKQIFQFKTSRQKENLKVQNTKVKTDLGLTWDIALYSKKHKNSHILSAMMSPPRLLIMHCQLSYLVLEIVQERESSWKTEWSYKEAIPGLIDEFSLKLTLKKSI
jgi:hypothetical protein